MLLACARQLHECEMLASDYLGRVCTWHSRTLSLASKANKCTYMYVISRTREIFMRQRTSALRGTQVAIHMRTRQPARGTEGLN